MTVLPDKPVLDAGSFGRLAVLVRREAAIVLEAGKEYLVEARLGPLMRRQGIATYAELVAKIESPTGFELRELAIDAMTTNETSFFRDGHPWDALRETLLPNLIAARRSTRQLRVWCAAASSGQEPYSLAMMLKEHFPQVVGWDVRILATDLSPSTLARAASGKFTQLEVNRGLPAALLMKHFTRQGTEWRISDEIRTMVDFRVGNLIDDRDWDLVPQVDAVFMRNVLIYFDMATRGQIVDKVHARLRPDGFLMLGSAESTVGKKAFERVQLGRTSVFAPASGVPGGGVGSARPAGIAAAR